MKHFYVLIPKGSQATIEIEGEQQEILEIRSMACPYCGSMSALTVFHRKQFFCFECEKHGIVAPF